VLFEFAVPHAVLAASCQNTGSRGLQAAASLTLQRCVDALHLKACGVGTQTVLVVSVTDMLLVVSQGTRDCVLYFPSASPAIHALRAHLTLLTQLDAQITVVA
jgi:hypothetical protein